MSEVVVKRDEHVGRTRLRCRYATQCSFVLDRGLKPTATFRDRDAVGGVGGRTVLSGALEGGALEDGALEGGALEGGALEGGALEGGALEGGALEGGVNYFVRIRVFDDACDGVVHAMDFLFDRRAVKHGSRGLQPTELSAKGILSHRDNGTQSRKSPQQIPLVQRQSMLCYELAIFLLESRPGMMLTLSGNVLNRVANLRLSDGKRAISVLPCKFSQIWKLLGNPFRRLAFESSHPFAQTNRRRQPKQQMDVILHAADVQRFHLVRSTNTTHVTPNALFDLRSNPAFAILGGEDDVQVNGSVGVRHIRCGRFLGTLLRCRYATQCSFALDRGLKPTATVLDRDAVERFRDAVERFRDAVERFRDAVERFRDAVERLRGAVERLRGAGEKFLGAIERFCAAGESFRAVIEMAYAVSEKFTAPSTPVDKQATTSITELCSIHQ